MTGKLFVPRERETNSSRGCSPKKSRGLKCGSGHRDLIGSICPYQLVLKVGPERVGVERSTRAQYETYIGRNYIGRNYIGRNAVLEHNTRHIKAIIISAIVRY